MKFEPQKNADMEIIKISADELFDDLQGPMQNLERGKYAYCIRTLEPTFRGEYEFYLVPLVDKICEVSDSVDDGWFGDPEYGWPSDIELSEIKEISDIIPMWRKHPLIKNCGIPVAISLQVSEFLAMSGN